MERNEMIFFAVIIIAYLICALTLNIPAFIHYIFIAIVAIVLIITLLLKYQQKFENGQISKKFMIIAAISLVLYIISLICETYMQKTLIDPAILLVPFFGALVVSWFFKKEDS